MTGVQTCALPISATLPTGDIRRASSAMELEAVGALAKMAGWSGGVDQPQPLGHLTSGGTFANLEALWIAGQLASERGRPRGIAGSDQAHYTHARISAALGLPFVAVRSDDAGRIDLDALEAALRAGEIGRASCRERV